MVGVFGIPEISRHENISQQSGISYGIITLANNCIYTLSFETIFKSHIFFIISMVFTAFILYVIFSIFKIKQPKNCRI